MKHAISFRGLVAATALAVSAVVVPVAATATPVSAACTWCAGGEYHALAPARIFDTRDKPGVTPINDVAPLGAKPLNPSNPTFDIQLLGEGGVPVASADVLAVAVSITVVGPTQNGYLGAYASGSPSVNSVLNFRTGQTVPNLAIVRPGANGKLTIVLNGDAAGTADVLIDVFGWWSTSTYTAGTVDDDTDERGARLELPATGSPGRIVDTRSPSSPLTAGTQRDVTIRGAVIKGTATEIVPDSPDVIGVLVNVTAVSPTSFGYVSVVPETPVSAPTTSNLNLAPGQTKANLVLVPVGDDGKIHLYNSSGSTHLLVDVMGVLRVGRAESTRAGRVVPLTSPYRVLDTRQAAFGAVPLGPGQAEDWSFANFAASVNVGGISVGNQSALLGNLTNAKLTRQYPNVGVTPSYLTACPGPCPVGSGGSPTYSNVNTVEYGPVPNLTLVPYGTNYAVRIFNERGYAHYILDVSAVVLAD
ncbi:MAG: hypothetical protein ABMA25_14500 [Ilumatobacteraceae bacterium]